jgi:hypothetical protein
MTALGPVVYSSFSRITCRASHHKFNDPMSQNADENTPVGTDEITPTVKERTIPLDVSRTCVAVVEKFKTGALDKLAAVLELQKTIPKTSDDDPTYTRAFAAYFRMLESFEEYRRDAGSRSHTLDDPSDAVGTNHRATDSREIAEVARPTKRARSTESDDDDEEDEHPSRKRIDVDALPWIATRDEDELCIHPSLRKTRDILENNARDIKYARSSLLSSLKLPQFPLSEWNNLLTGQAVDLDRVLSGIHAASYETSQKEKLGSHIEVTTGALVPARTVKTYGDWVTAWVPTVAATTFVFPHRKTELDEYGRQIMQLFATLTPDAHNRVIHYDKAVRIRVAQRRDLLLTDSHQFHDLEMWWINTSGAGAYGGGRGAKPGSATGKKPREACRRWNTGHCPDGASCRYAHTCSNCRANDHRATTCKKQPVAGKVGE